jgi:guanylate kinase
MAEGKDVLLEIEIQGALKIKEKYPDAVLIFITTKDAKTLKERLTGRGTETEEVINQRLARAAEEAEGVEAYDYIVINDILEDCVKTVDRIIKSEHNRTSEKLSTIQDIRMNLVSKGEIE